MTSKVKPMLAAAANDIESLPYPMIASPKLDGIRCLKLDGKVLTRSLKPIPNTYIREFLEQVLPEGADGEVMVGDTFQETTSGVMSHKGEPDFTYWMFDIISDKPYTERLEAIAELFVVSPPARCAPVPVETIESPAEMIEFEAGCLDAGFEGVCMRTPDSPYKYGRSTLKQGWLLKLKRFVDSEAVILDVEEQYRNTNEAETDELGHTKRAKTKDGREGKGILGRFLVRDLVSGVEFAVGTGIGLTLALREEIWNNRVDYVGKIVKYKSQPFGVKEAPRLPIFLGFRDERDM